MLRPPAPVYPYPYPPPPVYRYGYGPPPVVAPPTTTGPYRHGYRDGPYVARGGYGTYGRPRYHGHYR